LPSGSLNDANEAWLRCLGSGPGGWAKAQYPAVLAELGNMTNAGDAAQMESADSRAKFAAALTAGITNYQSGKAP
jgi:N-acetylmuramoyl-L-alanine amidase